MAVVVWEEEATCMLENHLQYAANEFGAKTERRWVEEIEDIVSSLAKYPTSFTPVRELSGKPVVYRGCTVMRNFKLIYYYDEEADMVRISSIWDMRRNPTKLISMYKDK